MTTSDTNDSANPMEFRLRHAIGDAIQRTMSQICPHAPELKQGAPVPEADDGISTAIDFEGDAAFTITLTLPRVTTGPLMKIFTGVPIDFDAPIMEDVVGELLNVIAGDVVAELGRNRVTARMGLPRVDRVLDTAGLHDDRRSIAEFGLVDPGSGPYHVAVLVPATVSDPA